MKPNFIKLTTLLSLCLLVFTGCSQITYGRSNQTLEVVTMFGNNEQGDDHNANTFQTINESFTNIYPEFTIEDESSISDEEWKMDVLDDFATGNEKDIYFFFTGATAEPFVENNQVVSVEEIRATYPNYASHINQDILDSIVAADGKTYAIPLTGYYEGLFCNKDLFEKHNIPLPTDWDSFLYAIEAFQKVDIVPVAVSLDDIPHYWIEHLVLSSAGIEGHRENPKDTPPSDWVEGLEYFKTLKDLGAFPTSSQVSEHAEAEELFKSKKAAMQVDGSWYINGLPDKDNVTILPFPQVPGGKMEDGDIIAGFSSGFYITRKAWDNPAKREAMVEYISMQIQPSSIARYWWGAGFPAGESVSPVGMQQIQKDGNILTDSAKQMDDAIDSRMSPEAYGEIINSVSSIADGKMSAEEALKNAISKNQ